MEQLSSHWTNFNEIWFLRLFWKYVQKIQVLLKSDKNKAYFIRNQYTFHIISCSFILTMRNISDKIVGKITTHILCWVTIFLKTVYFVRKYGKILYSGAGHIWQNGACPLHARCLRLQIHTLRLLNTHCFFAATMVARTRLNCYVIRTLSALLSLGPL